MNMKAPENYHNLSRAERDHLVAAALMAGEEPNGLELWRRVGDLRQTPSKNTTYAALDRLTEWDLLDKEIVDGRTTAYEITDDGLDLLAEVAVEWPV